MSLSNFIKDMINEHNNLNLYEFDDYYTFDTLTDLHEISINPDIPSGVYVSTKNPRDIILKEFDEEGRILLGFSNELTSVANIYKAIEGGLMLKDDSKLSSVSESEEFLVMGDIYGYDPFILVKTTCDDNVNLINWYGNSKEFEAIDSKKGKKK
ncbi:MAG: hypothetical protein M0R17_00230 [Candidatus Omnitrophica bacterium]|nr:hypothetical protein [Candidatus Omnitrophota bacterium]